MTEGFVQAAAAAGAASGRDDAIAAANGANGAKGTRRVVRVYYSVWCVFVRQISSRDELQHHFFVDPRFQASEADRLAYPVMYTEKEKYKSKESWSVDGRNDF